MSRIGKKTIDLAEGLQVEVIAGSLTVKGPKGSLEVKLPSEVEVKIEGRKITVISKGKTTAMQGLVRSLIQNAVTGVSEGFKKTLELVGVGYRAATSGKELVLSLGYSHPVKMQAPEGISFEVKGSKIYVSGYDKYLVGEVAAKIRRNKPPEPYKGKGIKYENEHIRKKAGKAAKAVGGAGGK